MTYPPLPGTPSPDPAGNPAPSGGYPPYGSVPAQPQPEYGQPEPPTQTSPLPPYAQPAPPYPQQAAPPYPISGAMNPAPSQPGQGAEGHPLGYGTPPAPPKKGRTGKILATVGSVLAVLCIAGVIRAVPAVLDRVNDPAPTHAQPSGIFATSDGEAAPTAPFEDTPAATYPEGEAGITLPAATAVAGFSKSEVEAALMKVKRALVATRLDQKMLVGHDISTFLAMLAPDAREDVQADFDKKSFFFYASHIADGYTLTSDPIRVKGRVTFRAKTNANIPMLEVITNFVWVYPFSGELEEPGDHLVIVHDEITWAFPVAEEVDPSSRGMWIYEANGFASNIDCELLDQSLLALGDPVPVVAGGSQDNDDSFNPDGTLNIEETC